MSKQTLKTPFLSYHLVDIWHPVTLLHHRLQKQLEDVFGTVGYGHLLASASSMHANHTDVVWLMIRDWSSLFTTAMVSQTSLQLPHCLWKRVRQTARIWILRIFWWAPLTQRTILNTSTNFTFSNVDTQTAESAIRNLQGIEIGGRALRLDFADVGNHDTRDAGGRPPPPKGRRAAGAGSQASREDFSGPPGRAGIANGTAQAPTGGLPPDLPRGQPLAAGQSATDQISQTLAAIPPGQLAEITSQMKVC